MTKNREKMVRIKCDDAQDLKSERSWLMDKYFGMSQINPIYCLIYQVPSWRVWDWSRTRDWASSSRAPTTDNWCLARTPGTASWSSSHSCTESQRASPGVLCCIWRYVFFLSSGSRCSHFSSPSRLWSGPDQSGRNDSSRRWKVWCPWWRTSRLWKKRKSPLQTSIEMPENCQLLLSGCQLGTNFPRISYSGGKQTMRLSQWWPDRNTKSNA